MTRKAILALENGTRFEGIAIGIDGQSVGEVVFNTAMSGYQEILTDPSYAEQIVTLTHPHIGNTGVTLEDEESNNIWAKGLIIRDLPLSVSSWRSESNLEDYLVSRGVVAIAGIDTRMLTGILRDEGSLRGAILCGTDLTENQQDGALEAAKTFPGLQGMDLAKVVSTADTYEWTQGVWKMGKGYGELDNFNYHVVAYDFGVKRNILRILAQLGCRLTVVPAQTPAATVLAMNPDGIFLSNGPGDPDPCDYAIDAIKEILETDIPVFGICLGLQLLALAAGLQTKKMGHGHHGANHPVKNLAAGNVLISSQNHGFCIDDASLTKAIEVTHRSLFDDSLQGIELVGKPAFGFQGHPEASPGPHDAAPLFDRFIELMANKKAA